MLKEQRFNTGTITLNYAEGGAPGQPLVLLHGGSARWQSFLPIIPDLEQHWHLYAPDLRGHGNSGWVPGSYRLEDYAGDIAALLEQVIRTPAILFGHSLGGFIAIMVAAHHPALVKGLIIGDAPFDRTKLRASLQRDQERLLYWKQFAGPDRPLAEVHEAVKHTPIAVEGQTEAVSASTLFGEENPWFLDMAENLRHNDPTMLDTVIEFDRMYTGYDCEQLFPNITCPVLIIQGSPQHGGLLTDEEIERALKLLPSAEVARMETVGHPLHTQQKEPVLCAMLPFLGRNTNPSY